MSHADTLRGMASDEHILAGRENPRSTALLAGADALDTVDRVRELLTSLRRSQQFTRRRWDATCDTWDGAVSDTLKYAIHRLTEALEGETNE